MAAILPARRTRAFTLIEMLIVIAIIGVLLAIVLGVAGRVGSSGKRSLTQDTLKILDTALEGYTAERGSYPDPFVRDPRTVTAPGQAPPTPPAGGFPAWPVVDGVGFRQGSTDPVPINSVALFMLQAKASPSAVETLRGLPQQSLREFSPDATGTSNPTDLTLQPTLPTAFDAWGNPIRYVHPAAKGVVNASTVTGGNASVGATTEEVLGPLPRGLGYAFATVRRNAGIPTRAPEPDADGGSPTADRPYFYSAGPDGNPTTTDDNIYLAQPKFPRR